MIFAPGTRLGRYEVRSVIGAGGMGEVYLAHDTRLNRRVALKLLSTSSIADTKRLRRFEHEARAASALNHPNILTIYEFGEADDIHFIATEFVDGETLRQRMRRASLKLNEILEIAAQVAAALAAAHQAGIVHRDIKPENIMLRPDGYVKVLDFGIAKLIEQPAEHYADASEAPTQAMSNTKPGMVVGTIAYMSPEQVRGLAVDARTDIWSLGCVLYEMTGGGAPFQGRTSNHIAVSILDQEPAPLALRASESSQMLEWVIAKALRKDKDERYQTARELLTDLRDLQQRLALDVERTVSTQTHGLRPLEWNNTDAEIINRDTPTSAERRTVVRSISSAEYLIGEVGRHKKSVALALLLLMIAASFVAYRFSSLLSGRSSDTATSFNSMKVTRLVAAPSGEARIAVISPDGKYIAHTLENNGQQSIWIGQTSASSSAQVVVPATDARYVGVTFSPDGNYLYYVSKQRNNTIGTLYRVPFLGGTSSKLLMDVDSPVTFSPDGAQLAFVRGSNTGERSIIVANTDGTNERKLSSRTGADFYVFAGPAWSPDNQKIACGAGTRKGAAPTSVVEVSLKDGTERQITARVWSAIGQVAWLKDGSGLVLADSQTANAATQLWYLSYASGEARRITNDLSSYNGISLANDSNTLISVQGEKTANIWFVSAEDASRAAPARQLTSNKYDGVDGLIWTPDGQRIIYTSNVGDKENLLTIDVDGKDRKQLTDQGDTYWWPSITFDGRYIFFVANVSGKHSIGRMDVDGNDRKQISDVSSYANVSPDGQWLVYTASDSGRAKLWRMNADASSPVELSDKSSIWPVVSPDSKMIVCYQREEAKSPWRIAVVSIENGALIKAFDVPPTVIFPTRLGWSPDSRSVVYIDNRNGVSNLWSQPIGAEDAAKQLTEFKTGLIFAFDWSRDKRFFALARGSITSDIVALSNFK